MIRMIVLILLVVATNESNAALVSLGDRILILGEIDDCPGFPGILEAQEVKDSMISFLNLPPIQAVGRTANEIRADISNAIVAARKIKELPRTLQVQVLHSEGEYLAIRDEILASVRFLAFSLCRTKEPKPSNEPTDPDWYRIARLPNRSLQRTPQSVTPFSSAAQLKR